MEHKITLTVYFDFDNTICFNRFQGEGRLIDPQLNYEIVGAIEKFNQMKTVEVKVLTARRDIKVVEDYLKEQRINVDLVLSSAAFAMGDYSADGKGKLMASHNPEKHIVALIDDIQDYLLFAVTHFQSLGMKFIPVVATPFKTTRDYLEEIIVKYTNMTTGKIFQPVDYEIMREKYLKEDYLTGGRADGQPDSKYDPEQLAIGIKIEKEHTDDPEVAKEIAKDHLEEIPDYYTRLLKMEKEAGIDDKEESLQESIVFSDEDAVFNFDKWGREEDILYLAGLSGSGKSTLGRELAKKYNAEYIELDLIEGKLVEKYGLDKLNKMSENDFFDLFYEYMLKESKGKKAVAEGIHILFFNTKELYDKPIIIKGTSYFASAIRSVKRNIDTDDKTPWAILMRGTLRNNHELEGLLSKFKKELNEHTSDKEIFSIDNILDETISRHKLDTGDSKEELEIAKILQTIDHGYVYKGKVYLDKVREVWKLQKPETTLKYKAGICGDKTLLVEYLFKKYLPDYKVDMYYLRLATRSNVYTQTGHIFPIVTSPSGEKIYIDNSRTSFRYSRFKTEEEVFHSWKMRLQKFKVSIYKISNKEFNSLIGSPMKDFDFYKKENLVYGKLTKDVIEESLYILTEEVPVDSFDSIADYEKWWLKTFKKKEYKKATNWKLQSPESYEKTKKGNCIDLAIFHHRNLSVLLKNGAIKSLELAYVADFNDGEITEGHMFNFVETNDHKFFNVGNRLHGPFKSFQDMADTQNAIIYREHGEDLTGKTYFILDPKKIKPGMNRREIRKIVAKTKPMDVKVKKLNYKVLNEHNIQYSDMKKQYPDGGWFHKRWAGIKWVAGKPLRHRCEVLVFHGDMLYMRRYDHMERHDPNWKYTIPGGGSEEALGLHDSILVEREAQEEANLKLKNLKFSGIIKTKFFGENGSKFMPFDGKLSSWAQEMVDAGFAYAGDWSKIYIADYDGDSTNIIDPIDLDKDMREFGKFYDIESVLPILREEHIEAIKALRPYFLGASENLKESIQESMLLVKKSDELDEYILNLGKDEISYRGEIFKVQEVDVYMDREKNVLVDEAMMIYMGWSSHPRQALKMFTQDQEVILDFDNMIAHKVRLFVNKAYEPSSQKDMVLPEDGRLAPLASLEGHIVDGVKAILEEHDIKVTNEESNDIFLFVYEDRIIGFDENENVYKSLVEGIKQTSKPFVLNEAGIENNMYSFRISDELFAKLKERVKFMIYEVDIDKYRPNNNLHQTLLKTI